MVDAVAVFVRAVSFIALFQAAGAAAFLVLFETRLGPSRAAILPLARRAAALALILVLLQFGLEAARMTGDFSGLRDPSMQQLSWHTALGTAVRLRLAGLVLVFFGLGITQARLASGLLTLLGTALLLAAFTALGHTVDHPHRAVLAGLLLAHLLCVTFWFGALWPLRQAVSLEAAPAAAALLERFSRLAVWIVPGLLLAGVTLVIALLPGWSAFRTAYGVLLLAKLAGFSVLMGFAAWNKLRLTPALWLQDPDAVPRLRRSLAAEYLLVGAVLAITALMTALYSPD